MPDLELALDGPRDALTNLPERLLSGEPGRQGFQVKSRD
jgi:hypothetical protein